MSHERNVVSGSTYLSDETPNVLYIYGIASDIDANSVSVGFKLSVADGMEGFGIYGRVCIFVGENETDWYMDDAKIATRQIPAIWTLSMRDFLASITNEECLPSDYFASELLRTMVDAYEVSGSIENVENALSVTVSFSRKRYVAHQFVVQIPTSALRTFLSDGSTIEGDPLDAFDPWDNDPV